MPWDFASLIGKKTPETPQSGNKKTTAAALDPAFSSDPKHHPHHAGEKMKTSEFVVKRPPRQPKPEFVVNRPSKPTEHTNPLNARSTAPKKMVLKLHNAEESTKEDEEISKLPSTFTEKLQIKVEKASPIEQRPQSPPPPFEAVDPHKYAQNVHTERIPSPERNSGSKDSLQSVSSTEGVSPSPISTPPSSQSHSHHHSPSPPKLMVSSYLDDPARPTTSQNSWSTPGATESPAPPRGSSSSLNTESTLPYLLTPEEETGGRSGASTPQHSASKAKRAARDEIDALDVTNPFGSFHHSSPYEAIAANMTSKKTEPHLKAPKIGRRKSNETRAYDPNAIAQGLSLQLSPGQILPQFQSNGGSFVALHMQPPSRQTTPSAANLPPSRTPGVFRSPSPNMQGSMAPPQLGVPPSLIPSHNPPPPNAGPYTNHDSQDMRRSPQPIPGDNSLPPPLKSNLSQQPYHAALIRNATNAGYGNPNGQANPRPIAPPQHYSHSSDPSRPFPPSPSMVGGSNFAGPPPQSRPIQTYPGPGQMRYQNTPPPQVARPPGPYQGGPPPMQYASRPPPPHLQQRMMPPQAQGGHQKLHRPPPQHQIRQGPPPQNVQHIPPQYRPSPPPQQYRQSPVMQNYRPPPPQQQYEQSSQPVQRHHANTSDPIMGNNAQATLVRRSTDQSRPPATHIPRHLIMPSPLEGQPSPVSGPGTPISPGEMRAGSPMTGPHLDRRASDSRGKLTKVRQG